MHGQNQKSLIQALPVQAQVSIAVVSEDPYSFAVVLFQHVVLTAAETFRSISLVQKL